MRTNLPWFVDETRKVADKETAMAWLAQAERRAAGSRFVTMSLVNDDNVACAWFDVFATAHPRTGVVMPPHKWGDPHLVVRWIWGDD
jgi:hypothetical protein